MKTWIKICGTTNFADAELAWVSGADAIGFVFASASKRCVTASEAFSMIEQLARPIERIGVAVDLTVGELSALHREAGLSGLQLHGAEPPRVIEELRQRIPAARIIKALHVEDGDTLKGQLEAYENSGADDLLLDHAPGGYGGTGKPFDWNAAAMVLNTWRPTLPIIIAGGLTAANVGCAIESFRPFGVDVVSGVEQRAGTKAAEKVRAFISAVRGAKDQRSKEEEVA